jgi:hypothetical protein
MLDLLHTSARALVTGGRLAYLIPTTYDFSEGDLPVHPCMEMVKVRWTLFVICVYLMIGLIMTENLQFHLAVVFRVVNSFLYFECNH